MPTPKFTERLAVGSAGVGVQLASTPASLADSIMMRVDSASIRWSDGATANASVGILMTPADPPLIYEGIPSALTFAGLGVNAVVQVAYYQGRFRL